MRKACLFIAIVFATVGIANGAVRDDKAVSRTPTANLTSRAAQNTKDLKPRATSSKTNSRTAVTSRNTSQQSRSARSTISARSAAITKKTRPVTTNAKTARPATTTNLKSRSAIITPSTQITTQSPTFDIDYNTCHDAYFTCMDQFCATASDTYRRCICSSKL